VEDALVHSAKNVGDGDGGRRSHLDEFIELLGRAAMDGYLEENEHYTFIHDGKILRFNLSRCYDKVRKYHSDHGLSATLFEVSEYRSRLKDENDGRGYVETISQNTPPINRSVGIYLEEASEVVDISESMFTNGDGSGGDKPTPLNTVEHGTRTTVIAEAHDQHRVDNDDIAQLGTLEDAVGSLNFVVWDTGNGTQTLRRGECYRLRNVKVDTYREETQIQVDEYTEVEKVERGTCWLTPEGNNCNERISETPRSVIVEEVRGEDGLTEDELLDRVVNRGVDREEAKASLNRHCRNGVIIRNNGLRLA
jgi:hypothetical protein